MAIATPYAYIYDLPGLGLVLMGYAEGRKWNALIPLIIFCVFTSLYAFLLAFWFLTGAIFLVAILVALWPAITEARGNFPLASTIQVARRYCALAILEICPCIAVSRAENWPPLSVMTEP